MTAVDFFCGGGGLTCGLRQAGIGVTLGIDVDPRFEPTYTRNNEGTAFLAADLRELTPAELASMLPALPREDLLFAACAPCQPFSKQCGANAHSRSRTLLGELTRFIEALRPGQLLIENVPGIMKVEGCSTLARFRTRLAEWGYEYWEAVLDAKNYGVPQTRRRYIMIAMLGGTPSPLPPTHGFDARPYVTTRQAIAHFPSIKAGETHADVPNHRAAGLTEINLERIKVTPPDGGDRRNWPQELMLDCHKNGHTGHTDVYGRMWWDRPAPALTSRCDSLSNGRYGHPEQDRAMSLREAAALQSFPDDYLFYGSSKRHITTQIGNAVPVKLAKALGEHILKLRSG